MNVLKNADLSRVPFIKEEGCLKRGRCADNCDIAMWQLHCSFLVQFLVFFVVTSPSQTLFPAHDQKIFHFLHTNAMYPTHTRLLGRIKF